MFWFLNKFGIFVPLRFWGWAKKKEALPNRCEGFWELVVLKKGQAETNNFTSKFPTLKELSKKVRSEINLVNVLWKNLFGLLWDHFGQCAVKELL